MRIFEILRQKNWFFYNINNKKRSDDNRSVASKTILLCDKSSKELILRKDRLIWPFKSLCQAATRTMIYLEYLHKTRYARLKRQAQYT